MPLRDPKELYADALKNHYALIACNVADMEMLQAVIGAAEAERSPAFVMVSMGARKYVKDFPKFIQASKLYLEDSTAPLVLHHDHCQTVEDCKSAVDVGVQSVMFDGSHHDFETNIALTRQVADYAHAHGVVVEAELGSLPGFEDEVFAENAVYTDPAIVCEFIERSGCDSLAIAVGTTHGGVRGDDYLPMDMERVKEITRVVGEYPLVLHGGASLPPELIAACNAEGGQVEYMRNCSEASIAEASKYGVCKVNSDVDNFLCYTTAIRKFFRESPAVYDPRKYLTLARDAFQKEVQHKMRNVVNSSNRY